LKPLPHKKEANYFTTIGAILLSPNFIAGAYSYIAMTSSIKHPTILINHKTTSILCFSV